MTQLFLTAVPQYGVAILFAVTLLSCLALPMPASLVMLAAGAFVAAGDLAVVPVLAAAFGGAVTGDQIGYRIGRGGGCRMWDRLAARPASARLMQRARDSLHAQAAGTVFFSRWLFSALGPWVNLAAGATRLDWLLFTLAAALGEAVWVGLYVGLGFAFAGQVAEMGQTLVSVIGALGAGLVALLLGAVLWRTQREEAD